MPCRPRPISPSPDRALSALRRQLALSLGFTQTLAWATTFYIPATMMGEASATLGVSRTVLLGGFSWSMLVSAFCAPRIGRFIDRRGGRPILIAGALITCVGLLALSTAASLVHWYAAWTILGVGMALGLYDTAFATIGRLLGREARPAIVGVTLMAGFASTLGWPTGTWLVHAYGWRIAIASYAAVQIVLILPVILTFIPRPSPAASPSAAAQASHTDAPATPPMRGAFVLLAIFFTSRATIGAIVSVHLLILLRGLDLPVDQAVGVAALIGPAQVGSRIIDFRLGRNLSPVVSSWIGAALLPLGVALTLGGAPAFVFALAYGMSNGIFTISRGTLPMHVYGPNGYATLLGRLAMPSLIAQAVMPTLLSPLIETVPAFWVLGGIGAVSFIAFCCLLPFRR